MIDHVDDSRLDNRYRIGVDEISYKRGRKFLTIVADHDSGNVVWVGKESSKAAFEEFLAALGPARTARIEAISLDGSSVYLPVTREQIPHAAICLDPFHVIKWTNEVVESVYGAEAPHIPTVAGMPHRRDWRRTRFVVRAGQERLNDQHRRILGLLRRHRYRLRRTWELGNNCATSTARSTRAMPAALKRWCTAALRSRIPAFANLVRRIQKHFDAVIAAVELGLPNSRLEGINAKIRLIQRRGFGYRDLDSLCHDLSLAWAAQRSTCLRRPEESHACTDKNLGRAPRSWGAPRRQGDVSKVHKHNDRHDRGQPVRLWTARRLPAIRRSSPVRRERSPSGCARIPGRCQPDLEGVRV